MAPSFEVKQRSRRRVRPGRSLWRRIRGPLARSRFLKNAIASLMAMALRFIARTNRRVEGSHDVEKAIAEHTPAIAALWHGQHLLGPTINPRKHRLVALFSRSADAELNALVAEKLGFEVVRGSGGRAGAHRARKGGASALIQLKRTLDAGCNVAMIADIPHGTPRQAGLGIVTLARLSGRPVVPVAIATSRRKVLEKTWDKTTINLPFGRSAVILGEPIFVPADADDGAMEEKRRQLTEALNRATRAAYALVDGRR
ncbi:lysophospholipid acyltransferase family protein [Chelativorans intermedius]|uniref:Lysophospholipid acyltransferase family protein n=1 Tax=Chelativorans intermedius TaxID=515947 RepID=A0ABV6D7M0_9HYPH|nr:lysophospholipid acyltransferase family protein [Chelativorans intermedius]MCT8999801.1 lysophospholipid acyltransferase family protein [Chelativorans intermedius]